MKNKLTKAKYKELLELCDRELKEWAIFKKDLIKRYKDENKKR